MVTIFYKVQVLSEPELSACGGTRRQPDPGSRRKSMNVVPTRSSSLRVCEKVMELSSSSYTGQGGGETWNVSVLGPLLLFLPHLCRTILGLCISGAIMRCFSSHLAIFRQLLLAAWTRGQPSNLRAIVD